jgi:YVTN family beta-propeller protein
MNKTGVVRFFLLGPFEVREDDRQIPVTGRRQKVLLALLLLRPGEVVARDRLIEELWRGNPPPTAENALHGLVAQVRKLLEFSDRPMLITRAPGYALEVDPKAIDIHQFESIVDQGHVSLAEGRNEVAAELLREALALWRGRPFDDLGDAPFVQAEAARLEELRLRALEDRIEADLGIGHAEDLVSELQVLVGREPYRERLRSQLMRALYRSGRQAEALASYRDARRLFVGELGIEPSPELQALERAILQQDASLLGPVQKGRPARGRRLRRVGGAVAGLLVIGGVVAAVLSFTGGSNRATLSSARPDSVAVIDPKTNRLVDVIPVGSTPIAVAVGAGSVWVVNSQDGTLSRIDPGTRRVTRTIGLGTPVSDVAVGFGSVWVANGTAGSLTRVDPRSNAPVATLRQTEEEPLVSPAALGVATGEGSVWLASGTKRLLRIDPATGRTIATVRVPAGPLAVAVGDGAVWVGSLARRVSRIEPNTNELTASIPVGDESEGIVAGNGAVWATVCCDSVWRIDPTTNVLTGTVAVGATPSGVATGEGSVWVASYGDGTVSRINPFTRRVTATVHIGHGAVDVAVGYGAVWVAVERRNVS